MIFKESSAKSSDDSLVYLGVSIYPALSKPDQFSGFDGGALLRNVLSGYVFADPGIIRLCEKCYGPEKDSLAALINPTAGGDLLFPLAGLPASREAWAIDVLLPALKPGGENRPELAIAMTKLLAGLSEILLSGHVAFTGKPANDSSTEAVAITRDELGSAGLCLNTGDLYNITGSTLLFSDVYGQANQGLKAREPIEASTPLAKDSPPLTQSGKFDERWIDAICADLKEAIDQGQADMIAQRIENLFEGVELSPPIRRGPPLAPHANKAFWGLIAESVIAKHKIESGAALGRLLSQRVEESGGQNVYSPEAANAWLTANALELWARVAQKKTSP